LTDSAETLGAREVPWRRDALIVAVVAFVHLVSHFFQLILAPIFPWLVSDFAFSYTELGFIMTVLFTVSGVSQAAAGFVVDRFGALVTLVGGLVCLALGAVVFSLAADYRAFLLGAVLVGLGNAVFHPVDFWLINHRVSVPRLGPAYSMHGLSGSLGWALAPVFLVGLAYPFGWRVAVAAAAVLPLVAIVVVWLYRDVMLADAPLLLPGQVHGDAPITVSSFAFLRSRALWLCFIFFAFVAAALGGVQSFSATIFADVYGLAVGTAALSVTIYMLASAVGMLAGGWLVARSGILERNIAIALALSTVAAVLVGAQVLPATLALALMAVMGFGSGLSGPSRDMLIRAATPPGSTGRVYGVVYSGLDLGIAVGPLLFGRMLDHGSVAEVFYAVAVCLAVAVFVAWRVAAATTPPSAATDKIGAVI